MLHLGIFLFSTILFFVLTPGILVSLPPKGNKYTVALVHAIIFAIVWYLTHKALWHLTEGFDDTQAAQLAAQQVAQQIAEQVEQLSPTTTKNV